MCWAEERRGHDLVPPESVALNFHRPIIKKKGWGGGVTLAPQREALGSDDPERRRCGLQPEGRMSGQTSEGEAV